MNARRKKKKTIWIRVIYVSILILIASGFYTAFDLYRKVLRPNITLKERDEVYFYVPTGSSFENVCSDLSSKGFVRNINAFIWVAEKKNYPGKILPGRYLIKNGMSNNELVNLLRSGVQQPVRITFNNIKSLEELSGEVCKKIEADSANLVRLLRDESFISDYGFRKSTVISMFLPNTYEFYWNTSAEDFFKRMAREFKTFWNENRLDKARKKGLSQTEVSTLASIVQAEQSIRPDERPRVAGLYLNRLRKGMKLESDPTVIFAMKNISVMRVLNEDRKIDSPYNTYLHKGLPPGPINIPEISSIEAVLNSEKHDYLYMCAREDFSGYHNFSKTFREHNIFANRYRKELNRRKIFR